MSSTAPARLETTFRRFTGLAFVAAASLRSRRPAPPPVAVAPVPQIASNPEQVAADELRRAYESLKQADPAATDAQLFRTLRLLVNRLENGGMRSGEARKALTRQPEVAPPSPGRRRDAWLSSLRDSSRLLRHTLLGN